MESILKRINALPEAGDGDGTITADVCSISIPNYANNLIGISYVKCENGICMQTNVIPDTSSYTINNVLCDSFIYIQYISHYLPQPLTNCEDIHYDSGHYLIKLSSLPGETSVINILYQGF